MGIDGSWPARCALHWAARYARATGAVLHAVRVLEWPVGFSSTSTDRAEDTVHVADSDLDPSYRHGMRRIFDEVQPLPAWHLGFAEGPTAPMLVRLAEDADLLVLGSRERSTHGDARVGDLGHYCISHARRPVVIVPVEHLEPPVPRLPARRPPALARPSGGTFPNGSSRAAGTTAQR